MANLILGSHAFLEDEGSHSGWDRVSQEEMAGDEAGVMEGCQGTGSSKIVSFCSHEMGAVAGFEQRSDIT